MVTFWTGLECEGFSFDRSELFDEANVFDIELSGGKNKLLGFQRLRCSHLQHRIFNSLNTGTRRKRDRFLHVLGQIGTPKWLRRQLETLSQTSSSQRQPSCRS